jgi:hypothetical protein
VSRQPGRSRPRQRRDGRARASACGRWGRRSSPSGSRCVNMVGVAPPTPNQCSTNGQLKDAPSPRPVEGLPDAPPAGPRQGTRTHHGRHGAGPCQRGGASGLAPADPRRAELPPWSDGVDMARAIRAGALGLDGAGREYERRYVVGRGAGGTHGERGTAVQRREPPLTQRLGVGGSTLPTEVTPERASDKVA